MFVAEVFEVGEVAVEPLVAKVLEHARERMFGAELLVADGGEVEEVVPGATGVLQLFEAFGHGGGLWSGQALALVAGALGGLAEVVQVLLAALARVLSMRSILWSMAASRSSTGTSSSLAGLSAARSSSVSRASLGSCCSTAARVCARCAADPCAILLRSFSCVLRQVGGSFDRGAHRVVFVLEELVLHVAVTDSAGDAAKFFEAAEDFLRGGFVAREAFDGGEELELGLDAAGGGAELVDGFGGGRGNSHRRARPRGAWPVRAVVPRELRWVRLASLFYDAPAGGPSRHFLRKVFIRQDLGVDLKVQSLDSIELRCKVSGIR